MKTVILIIIAFWSVQIIAQNKPLVSNNTDLTHLIKPVQMNEEMQIQFCIFDILHTYRNAFKYYNELDNKQYEIIQDKGKNYIAIKNSSGVQLAQFELKKIRNQNSIENYDYNVKEIEKFVDKEILKKINVKNSLGGDVNVVNTDNMLRDCEILNFGTDQNYGKILNEAPMLHYVKNQDDSAAIVFYNIEDGAIIPYGSGAHAKLLALDNMWGAITTFDRDNISQGGHPYGYQGLGNNLYMNPTSFNNWSAKTSG